MTAHDRQILKDCRRWLRCAVVVDFRSEDSDWHCFRVERVFGGRIAFTGMTNESGDKHDGDFFWAEAKEIMQVKLRS